MHNIQKGYKREQYEYVNKITMAITLALHDEGIGAKRIARISNNAQDYINLFDSYAGDDRAYAMSKFEKEITKIMKGNITSLRVK